MGQSQDKFQSDGKKNKDVHRADFVGGKIMKNKSAKKKTSIITPILWVFITAMWIIIACVNSTDPDFPPFLFVLQCATAVLSAIAAVANYIRYKRSKDNNGE